MSDEVVVNGNGNGNGNGGDLDVEIAAKEEDSNETMNHSVQKLMQTVAILEQQKQQLMDDKESAREKIKELEDEMKMWESDKRALSSIAARAAELESEVSRVQHDLISSMSEAEESNAELSEMKRVVEELKKEKAEKLDAIGKERNLVLEKLKEGENRIGELEEEAKAKDEKIQSLMVKNGAESENAKKELEIEKKKWEMKMREMEQELDKLQKELVDRKGGDDKGLLRDWAVGAATATVIATVALVYFRHANY